MFWLIEYKGVWIGGSIIVRAPNREVAEQEARKHIGTREIYSIINLSKHFRSADHYMISDGDY